MQIVMIGERYNKALVGHLQSGGSSPALPQGSQFSHSRWFCVSNRNNIRNLASVPSFHRLFHSLRLWWQTWRCILLAVGCTLTSRRTLGVFATPMSAFFLLKIPRKYCTRLGAARSRTVMRLFPFFPFSGAEWLLFLVAIFWHPLWQ